MSSLIAICAMLNVKPIIGVCALVASAAAIVIKSDDTIRINVDTDVDSVKKILDRR